MFRVWCVLLIACEGKKQNPTDGVSCIEDSEHISNPEETGDTDQDGDTAAEDSDDFLVPDYDCGDASMYDPSPIGMWRVCMAKELTARDSTMTSDVFVQLESDLFYVEDMIDVAIVERLQEVRIWVEYDVPQFPGGVYHPSSNWLSNNGYPEYWAQGIQLGNAANYLSWTQIQPAMIVHELSHAWHHQVLGYEQSQIKDAYASAMASGIYANVAYAGGGMQEAYATSNAQEYFAELTEAYFWENDFYPFVKSELESFDPLGYQAVVNAWDKD